MRIQTLALLTATVIAASPQRQAPAATAEDFGYGSMKLNSVAVRGQIPLLVCIYQLTSVPGFFFGSLRADAVTVFDRLAFGPGPSLNLAGYFSENSQGQFSHSRAAVVGPVVLDSATTSTLLAQPYDGTTTPGGLDGGAGIGYMLQQVAQLAGYNFAQWDANGDGVVTPDELNILIVGNMGGSSGATRPIGANGLGVSVPVPGEPGRFVTLKGMVSNLDQYASFIIFAHELSHVLGTYDLRAVNQNNDGLALTGGTNPGGSDSPPITFHLDPWHKMLFGWVRPRIFELATGGVASVAAAQVVSSESPVILYSPGRGAAEYFLIEYRSNQMPGGGGYDRNAALDTTGSTNGMALWHYRADRGPVLLHYGAPSFVPGGSGLWTGMTPLLKWYNGASTCVQLNLIATDANRSRMTFEWIAPSQTWVDFQFAGIENGSFANPFNSITEAANVATHGGTVKIKTGSSSVWPSLTKRLTLEAVGGPVTISP